MRFFLSFHFAFRFGCGMIFDYSFNVAEVALGHISHDGIFECCHSVTVFDDLLNIPEAQEGVERTRDVGVARAYSVHHVDIAVWLLLVVGILTAIVDKGGKGVPSRRGYQSFRACDDRKVRINFGKAFMDIRERAAHSEHTARGLLGDEEKVDKRQDLENYLLCAFLTPERCAVIYVK